MNHPPKNQTNIGSNNSINSQFNFTRGMDNICYPLVKIFPYFIHIVFAIPKFYIS